MNSNKPTRRPGDLASEAEIKAMHERLQAKCKTFPIKDQLGLCAAPLEWETVDRYHDRSRCGNYTVTTTYVREQPDYSAWAKDPATGKFFCIDNKHGLDKKACRDSCQNHADRMVQIQAAAEENQ